MDSEQAMIMDVTRGGPLEKWFGGRGRGWGKSDLGGGGGVEEKVIWREGEGLRKKWFGGRGRGWGKSDLGGEVGVEEKVYQGKYTGKNPAWGKR